MSAVFVSSLAVLAAYLIGAIPFGYLIARWRRGIDIRTVGSGNIGATNVGRVLGFPFFCLVFGFDLAKGMLPTYGFPLLVERLTGRPAPPGLAVFVALAAILGHNFPVYLKFKGGKGVATSLGAMLALDPVAGVASAFGFTVFLLVTRYVSASSIGGGLVFFLIHFLRVDAPWSPEQRAMSLSTVGLLVLLVSRHRKNVARIVNGTEPKVSFRKFRRPHDTPRSGRIAASWLVAIAVLGAILMAGVGRLWSRAETPEILTIGRSTLREVARAGTGHQRAERVAFANSGRLLAVTCPRYNRLVLYRVTGENRLDVLRDLTLDGQPVAIYPARDRLFILERPPGDDRHVEPGWWETVDFAGNLIGHRVRVGYYPDDLALSADGRHAFVLTSGRAEGSDDRGAPALEVFELGEEPATVGRVTFEGKADDPARLTLSTTGRCAVVTLNGSNVAASLDLSDPAHPRAIGRSSLAPLDHPYPSASLDDVIVMPVASASESAVITLAGVGDCLAFTLPHGSGFEIYEFTSSLPRSLGRLTLRSGTFNLGKVRPTGLTYSAERGLLAVANRSGGVHLVSIRDGSEQLAATAVR